MMIYPIRAFDDNYIWVIVKEKCAIVIDAGEAQPVLDFLTQNELSLSAILITHHHHDYIGGTAALKEAFPDVQIIAHQEHGVTFTRMVDEGDTLTVLGVDFWVWRSAGHTDTHLTYLCRLHDKIHVFCGDTLFRGGCGRVFTGTMAQLFDSLMRFQTLPPESLFYPAHEYTLANLKFGQHIEPDNEDIRQAIRQTCEQLEQNQPSLPTSVSDEHKINVFWHCQESRVIDRLRELEVLGEDVSALAVFRALRELKNNF